MDDEAGQPWHTSSTLSPSPRSSPPSRSRSLSLRSVTVGATIVVWLAVVVEIFTFDPPAWIKLVAIVSIPAVSISLSYFGGASIHTAIAYTTIRREADRSRAEYKQIIREEILPPAIAEIKRDVQLQIRAIEFPRIPPFPSFPPFPTVPDYGPRIDEMRDELRTKMAEIAGDVAAIQIPSVKAELEAFLQSDDGRAWTAVIAESAGHEAANVLTQRTTSAAGAAARTAQSKLYKLLEGRIQFNNPILDGAWALAPPEARRAFINGLIRVLRQAGVVFPDQLGEIVDGELVSQDGAEAPYDARALPAAEDIEWPPRS